jgi:predicted AAA+ superfamily ATPase
LTSKTISKYIDWICGSILLYRVKYYDIKTKSVFKTKSKYYAGDIGVSNSLNSFNLSNNYGHLLENIIYLELLRRGYEVYTFDNRFNKNIDFLVIRNNKREYFQVTTILNDLNWNREVGNLLSINDNFNKTVLFMENTASNDIDNGIVFMNVLDWLLDK